MKFGIVGNRQKAGLGEAVVRLIRRLESAGIAYLLDEEIAPLLPGGPGRVAKEACRTAEACARESDILVAFGGDGTILSVARTVGEKGTPILGINLGKLGFLAELAPEEIEQSIGDIVAGRYLIEDRLVLEGEVSCSPGRTLVAFNDVVIDKSRSSRMIKLETFIDGVFAATYRGDGLILSTPTGSTGYALSSGGPIVVPTSSVIGITPISPHTLSGRPLIVPEMAHIRVVVDGPMGEVLVSADGQEEVFVSPPVEVNVRRAHFRLRLVKRVDRSYFDVLRAKLMWGKDARATG